MNYNPAGIEGKRPKGGEVWIDESITRPVIVIARRTISTLYSLGRRDNLAECEDQASLVAWVSPDGKRGNITTEKEFVKEYKYMGTQKSLSA